MKPWIAVVGSLNMDFVVSVQHLPDGGETVLGSNFQMVPGGKGANQACAAGKLGGSAVGVRMVGRCGYDLFADHLKASLSAAGVDVSFVHAVRALPTGVALITVDAAGQNTIVVASGANMALTAGDVEAMRPALRGADCALFQLEVPLDTVEAGLRLAAAEGVRTILDPAPAQALPRSLMERVDILTPNETEACALLGRGSARISIEEAPAVAEALLDLGARAVVLKLGHQGAFFRDRETELLQPGFRVEAVDSTAAGDVFNGALAVALAEKRTMAEALRFGCAAAAISVTRHGAQTSMPARSQVDEFLALPH